MEIKPRPNHRETILALRRMTPEQRLLRAMELSDFMLQVFREGLRRRFPHLGEAEFQALYLERLEKCHNRNY